MLDHTTAIRFLADHNRGVLTTLKRNGRPQLSNIVYALLDGRPHISVSEGLAKTNNLRRDPRVSLHVTDGSFGRYLVVEGSAELTGVPEHPDDDTSDLLVDTYRAIAGEHPDWREYRQAMIDERRLVIHFDIERAYGFGVDR